MEQSRRKEGLLEKAVEEWVFKDELLYREAEREFLAEQTSEAKALERGEGVMFAVARLAGDTGLVGWK